MNRLVRIVAALFALSAVQAASAAQPEVQSVRSRRGAEVTFLTRADLPVPMTLCEWRSGGMHEIAAVNNDGIVAGMAQASLLRGCPLRGYLWDASADAVNLIAFPALPVALNAPVTALRVAALSTTGLVSGGMTIVANPFGAPLELATYANGLTSHLIPNFSSVFGVSNSGRYLSGFNEVQVPLLVDLEQSPDPIEVKLGDAFVESTILYKVSDTGVAVGSMLTGDINSGIICLAATASCQLVLGDPAQGFLAFIQGISSDGEHIYGFVNDDNLRYQLFSVSPTTYDVTPLEPGYLTDPFSPVTDDGTLVILDAAYAPYLFVPSADGSHAIYDVQTLVRKLGLPNGVSAESIVLSPNGGYAVFGMTSTSRDIVAARVYFPEGIGNWAKENLRPVPPIADAPAVLPAP